MMFQHMHMGRTLAVTIVTLLVTAWPSALSQAQEKPTV